MGDPLPATAMNEALSRHDSSATRTPGKSFSNFDISGGRNHIGDYYGSGSDSVLSRLPYADSAPFDSAHRQHERDCAQGTRLSVIEDIETWASGQHDCRIFWLNGLAGTGKSTIAQTIARRLDDSGRLGATFFFSKGGGDAGSASKLVCTIAVQLAERCDELRGHIESVVRRNERIASAALLDQWKKLIIQPLTMLDDLDARPPIVLIIDALDECDTERSIVAILQMLALALPGQSLPLRVLLTSRPEGPIRKTFAAMSSDLRDTFVLHHIETSIVNQDISKFLKAELTHIGLQRALPANWIDDRSIAGLTESSGGLFIWAATACRYISDGRRYADRRFHQLMGQGQKPDDGPEAKLDSVYLMVLDNSISPKYTAQEREDAISLLRLVLGSLSALYSSLSAVALSRVLGLPLQDVGQTLEDLHAILDVPVETTRPLRLHHPSLRDFLFSRDRCTNVDFCVDGAKAHYNLATACLRIMSASLQRDICQKDDPAISVHDVSAQDIDRCIPTELRYACSYWIPHITSGGGIEDFDVLCLFLTRHLLHWLEAMSWIGKLQESIALLLTLASYIPTTPHPELRRFLDDAYRFALDALVAIETYPLQTYVSAILFAPNRSVVKRTFQKHATPKWLASGPSVPENWSSLLHTLESKAVGYTTCVAFSKHDQWLATGSVFGAVEIWSVITGSLLHLLEEHSYAVSEVRFCSSGMRLASASRDPSVKMWEMENGECLWTLPIASLSLDPGSKGQTMCFLQGDRQLLLVTMDGSVQLCDVDSGATIYRHTVRFDPTASMFPSLPGHQVACTGFSPRGERVAIAYFGDRKHEIWLWDTGKRSSLLLSEAESEATAVVFTSETHMTALDEDAVVRTWDCATATMLKTVELESESRLPPVISPDGTVAARWAGSVPLCSPMLLLSLTTFEELTPIECSYARTAVFSPSGDVLAALVPSLESEIVLYDTATSFRIGTLRPEHELLDHETATLIFSNSGNILLSRPRCSNQVQLWMVRGSVQEVWGNNTNGLVTVYTNGMDFGLRSLLSTDSWKHTKLTLTPTSDEWIVAFGKRIIWVPHVYRFHGWSTTALLDDLRDDEPAG